MLFSIVTPVYNRLNELKNMVQSVLYQSYGNFELIIVDNGSNDGTLEYCNLLKDKRIKVLSCMQRGIAFARNAGIDVSRGDWVIILDSDNVFCSKNSLNDLFTVVNEFCNAFCILTRNKTKNGNVISFSKYLDMFIGLREYLQSSGEFSQIYNGSWIRKSRFFEEKGIITEFSFLTTFPCAIEKKMVLSSLILQIYNYDSTERICSPVINSNRANELYSYYDNLFTLYRQEIYKSSLTFYIYYMLKLIVYGRISKKINFFSYLKKYPFVLLFVFLLPLNWIIVFVNFKKKYSDKF